MRYALLVRYDESAEISPQERARREAAFAAFQDEMQVRGVLLGSERLCPAPTAATVRCWDGGDVLVGRGPHAETREQIADFCTVDCKDLDEAIEVATRVPAAWYGTVEVRPVWEAS